MKLILAILYLVRLFPDECRYIPENLAPLHSNHIRYVYGYVILCPRDPIIPLYLSHQIHMAFDFAATQQVAEVLPPLLEVGNIMS